MIRKRFSDEKAGSALVVYYANDTKVEDILDELTDDGYDMAISPVSDCGGEEAARLADEMIDTLGNSAALLLFKPSYAGAPEGFELVASLLAERAAEINIPVALVVMESPDSAVERSAVRKIRDALRLCRAPKPRPQRPERPVMPDIGQVKKIAELTGVPEDELLGYAWGHSDGEDW